MDDIELPIIREVFLDKLKRLVRERRLSHTGSQKHAWFLDQLAQSLAYGNWSQLRRSVDAMSEARFDELWDFALEHLPGFERGLEIVKLTQDEEAEAIELMQNWVTTNYSPLISYAFFDNESENGFAESGVDLNDVLQSEFQETYPLDLIEQVAIDMELDQGPWGDENSYYRD